MKYQIKEITKAERIASDAGLMDDFAILDRVYNNQLKHYGILDKGGSLVSTFSIYSYQKLWQKHIITPPFLTDIQLKATCSATNPAQINSFYRDILTSIASLLENESFTYLEIVLPHTITDALPFTWSGFKVGVKYTYFLDLNLSKDELLKNMSSQRRKNIRDAEKLNLQVREIHDAKTILEKASATLASKKVKYNNLLVEKFAHLADSNQLTSIGIYDADKLVALSSCVNLKGQSTYLFGWNDGEAGKSFAGTYALWNCILTCKNQSGLFNFAGSQIPSIEKYFRGFGGKLTPLISVISDKRKLSKKFT